MARFCTHCKTTTGDAADFCDHCGASLDGAPRRRMRRIVAVLLVAAGGVALAAWMLADEAPSNRAFGHAVNLYYRTHPAENEALVCLGHFPFDKDSVLIDPDDSDTNDMLLRLAAAGLYLGPRQIRAGRPADGGRIPYQYARTELGREATKGTRLCAASAIRISDLHFAAPIDTPQGKRARISFHYELAQPASWLRGGLAARAVRMLELKRERVLWAQLVEHKWVIVEPDASSSKPDTPAEKPAEAPIASGQGPIFDKISIISDKSNPLLGKWHARQAALPAEGNLQFVFEEQQANWGEGMIKVHYAIKGNTIEVRRDDDGHVETFVLVDATHLRLVSPHGTLMFERNKD